MSKLAAISYSLLLLIQSFNINFEDISKFKILLDHANYHEEVYGDSFVDFISKHYGDAEYKHGHNQNEHENLPFKDCKHLLTHINSSFTFHKSNYDFQLTSFVEIRINFFYKESSSLFEKHSVFQPPKFA